MIRFLSFFFKFYIVSCYKSSKSFKNYNSYKIYKLEPTNEYINISINDYPYTLNLSDKITNMGIRQIMNNEFQKNNYTFYLYETFCDIRLKENGEYKKRIKIETTTFNDYLRLQMIKNDLNAKCTEDFVIIPLGWFFLPFIIFTSLLLLCSIPISSKFKTIWNIEVFSKLLVLSLIGIFIFGLLSLTTNKIILKYKLLLQVVLLLLYSFSLLSVFLLSILEKCKSEGYYYPCDNTYEAKVFRGEILL